MPSAAATAIFFQWVPVGSEVVIQPGWLLDEFGYLAHSNSEASFAYGFEDEAYNFKRFDLAERGALLKFVLRVTHPGVGNQLAQHLSTITPMS